MAAFNECELDGSKTISKRELLVALKMAGLKDSKNALDLFQGFDGDGNGELDFDEFEHIAKTVFSI